MIHHDSNMVLITVICPRELASLNNFRGLVFISTLPLGPLDRPKKRGNPVNKVQIPTRPEMRGQQVL